MTNAVAASEYTNEQDCKKMLSDTRKLYTEMHKVIETFNTLFGYVLLLMAVQCSLQILDFGVFLIEMVLPNFKFEYDAFFIYMGFILLDLIWLSVAQSRCEMAKDESMKLRSACYNLLDNSSGSGDLHQELKALIKQIKNRPVRFTAADFFEIKRSTTFTIVGATATYFIVYVELRSNDNTTWNNGTL
uniref:Gustatory receptor n=1 Tax=Dendroctonus ponderosae TaxID=77166 RepID=A0AAR5PIG5_DENPD